jgi:enterochelin esterase family protein
MGGFQTFHVTLNNLDLFSHIGGFSGAGGMLDDRKMDPKNDFNGVLSRSRGIREEGASVVAGYWHRGTCEIPRTHSWLAYLAYGGGIQHVYWESPAPITNGRPGAAISRISRPLFRK